MAYQFAAGSIRHVHGVFPDPYSDRLWIPTGDGAGECYLVSADYDFTDVVRYGDGSQAWRAVTLFFEPDRIVWGMDSERETSYLQIFDRRTAALTRGCAFPGPVWYGKRLAAGPALVQTTVEIGSGCGARRRAYSPRPTWSSGGRSPVSTRMPGPCGGAASASSPSPTAIRRRTTSSCSGTP